MSLNPTCTVNNGAAPADVATGASVEIELEFPAGALFWGITAISADETTNVGAINASLSVNQTTKKATFTAPSTLGSCVIFQSTVGTGSTSTQGAGRDLNGVLQPTWTTTLKVNVPTTGGLRVLALNETYEQNASAGWIEEVNRAIRASGGGGGSAWLTAQPVSGGGSATGANGTMTFVDASGGTCTVNPPSAAVGVRWGVCDGKKGGSFNASHGASIPNAGLNVEDPNNPGVYTTNTIVMQQPGQSATWMADPTGAFFKLTGG